MSSKHLNELVPKKALLASAVAVALLSTNAFAAPPTATYLINGNDSNGALDLSSQNLEVQPNDVYQIYGWYHSETINRYRSEEADVTLTGLLISSENSRFAGAVNEDRRGCHEFCVLRDNSRPRRALPTRQHAKQDPTQTYS